MSQYFFRQACLIIASLVVMFNQFMLVPTARAVSPSVVISEVATEASNASQEFIELYNNSSSAISMEGWSLQLRSSNNALNRTLPLSNVLKGQGFALLASTNHSEVCAVADFTCFTSTMATTGGHVVLLDSGGVVVDKLGWGPAVDPENIAAGLPSNTTSLNRVSTAASTILHDTDNNSVDFQTGAHTPTGGGVQEPEPEPEPEPVPQCPGISITEILPNPAGDDTNQEFIELYNETSSPVDLTGCILKVGTAEQTLSGTMDPGYRAFYGLNLPNSAGGQVQIITNLSTISVTYPANLGDDESYGFVGGSWQAGLVPTPGSANLMLLVQEQTEVIEEEMEACPPGKYRNPDTNRCRNIQAKSILIPCDLGQVRNPETNRCRKGTNSEASLTPCKQGQERNPETNRCRNVAGAKSTNPMATPAKAAAKPVSYYVLGIVAGLGLTYAAYEYRQSILNFINRLRHKS